MATFSEKEVKLAKEVMIYHQIAEYLKTYEAVATEESKRLVMASGFSQADKEFTIIAYLMKQIKSKEADDLTTYIREKYNFFVGAEEHQTTNFKWHQEEVVPGLLYKYYFWKKAKNGKEEGVPSSMTSHLYYH